MEWGRRPARYHMISPELIIHYGTPPIIKATFCISGRDFDPQMITKGLGIQPTEIWTQKHAHVRECAELVTDSWNFEIQDDSSRSVSEAVERLLEHILPMAERLPAVLHRTGTKAGVFVTVTITEDRPVYDLSAQAIKWLALLNCEFSIDIFDYSSDEPSRSSDEPRDGWT